MPKQPTTTQLARVRELVVNGEAKRIREMSRLSLGELAADVGCSPATIFRYESRERSPRGAVALRYLRVLDRLAAAKAL